MAGYGPPEDPSRQPTRRGDINPRRYPPPAPPPRPPGPPDPAPVTGSYPLTSPGDDEPPAPTPWYRKRVVLIAWGLLVLILIALIIYGLIDLAGRGGAPTPTPTTTPTTTSPTSPTTATTTPTTTSPSPSTTEEPAPSSEPPRAPAPPPPGAPAPPSHRHHLPKLPPTISVPGGPVITLPPGL